MAVHNARPFRAGLASAAVGRLTRRMRRRSFFLGRGANPLAQDKVRRLGMTQNAMFVLSVAFLIAIIWWV